MDIYDSKYRKVSTAVRKQIASLLFTSAPEIILCHKDLMMQSGSADCGLFAIASATALVLGEQPGDFLF